MGRRLERNDQDHSSDQEQFELPPKKKARTASLEQTGDGDPGAHNNPTPIVLSDRPKSKKELRAEKKRGRRLATDPEYAALEKKRLEEAQEKEEEREQLKQLIKEERKEKKIRQNKRQNRERNAPGSSSDKRAQKEVSSSSKASTGSKSSKLQPPNEEDDIARKVMNEIKYGKSDTSGWTTMRLGVKYKDLVVGTGPEVQTKSLVTVKYQLTGGKFGAVIDSSKKFAFRVGKGEVIQGWDIGVTGMKEGGRRQLVVPPKAGYGSQDIGAGPGGLLHFDITVVNVR